MGKKYQEAKSSLPDALLRKYVSVVRNLIKVEMSEKAWGGGMKVQDENNEVAIRVTNKW